MVLYVCNTMMLCVDAVYVRVRVYNGLLGLLVM